MEWVATADTFLNPNKRLLNQKGSPLAPAEAVLALEGATFVLLFAFFGRPKSSFFGLITWPSSWPPSSSLSPTKTVFLLGLRRTEPDAPTAADCPAFVVTERLPFRALGKSTLGLHPMSGE